MYLGLVKKSIQENLKNYMIYFVTVIISISIYFALSSSRIIEYGLNLNGELDAMGVMSINSNLIISTVFIIIGFTCILIYANTLFLDKRGREVGIYLTLGMGKKKIMSLLLLETLIFLIVALFLGVIGGVILGQGILVAILCGLHLSLSYYKFIFSTFALKSTLIFFISLFIVIGIINISVANRSISHNLKKKKIIKKPRIIINTLIFIIGIAGFIFSNYLIYFTGFKTNSGGILIADYLLIVFLILILIGGMNIGLIFIEKNTKCILKGINIFTINKFISNRKKIIITSVISGLLIMVSMLWFNATIQGNKDSANLVNIGITNGTDASIQGLFYFNNLEQLDKIMQGVGANKDYNYAPTMNICLDGNFAIKGNGKVEKYSSVNVVSLDWYNKYLNMLGQKEMSLKNNQAIVIVNTNNKLEKLKELSKNEIIKFNTGSFKVVKNALIDNFQNGYSSNTPIVVLNSNDTIVVNTKDGNSSDNSVTYYKNNGIITLKGDKTNIISEYGLGYFTSFPTISLKAKSKKYNTAAAYNSLTQKLNNFISKPTTQSKLGVQIPTQMKNIIYIKSRVVQKANFIQNNLISKITNIFLGVIFVIGGAIILLLQIVIEKSDYKESYNILNGLGASNDEINKSILSEIILRFAIPIVFAILIFIAITFSIGFFNFTGTSIGIVLSVVIISLYGVITYKKSKV